MTTPRFIPTSRIAQVSAFWAYPCSFVSIVKVSESPGCGAGDGLEDLLAPALGIAFDALAAVYAPKLALVDRLDAGLADEIVGQVPDVLELGELLTGHWTGVAEDLRQERPVGVLATGLDHDLHAGQLVAGLGDEPGGHLVDIARDSDEVERRAGVAVDGGVDVGDGHAQQRREPVHDGRSFGERQVGGTELDHERRDVGHERAPIAVVDDAARSDDRLEDGAVSRGQRRQPSTVDDLEVEQPRREAADPDDGDEGEGEEPGEAADRFRPLVEERGHQSIRSVSARRSWIEIASGPITAARMVS